MVGIRAIQQYFWEKKCESFNQGRRLVTGLDSYNRFIAGLMLYWAEGNKKGGTAITNSDPRLIKFMIEWLKENFDIQPTDLVGHIHMHSGQNEEELKKYWADLTGIPTGNFGKSFIKPEGSGYRKKILYKGTIKIRIRKKGSVYNLYKVLGGIAGFLQKAIGLNTNPENWMEKLPHAK